MADLSLQLLLVAYMQGAFPMAHDDGRIYWYDPDPRAIIPLETFRANRRLSRTVRNAGFELRVNTQFQAVMQACAEPRPGHHGTWISPELIDIYTSLHWLGFAHSVETWQNGRLVGGLYGVALRGLFAGESMFSRQRDASKVALVYLIERLRRKGFVLLDTQYINEHMARLGAIEIPRDEYRRRLAQALAIDATF